MTTTPTTWLDTFLTNLVEQDSQRRPEVIGLANGNVLVAWEDTNATAGSSFGQDIVGVIFDALGRPISDSLFLNNGFGFTREEDQFEIAATPDGGFVVVYRFPSGDDTDLIFGRYDAEGARTGADFIIPDGSGAPTYGNPSVAVASDGSFFVTYEYTNGADNEIRGVKVGADDKVGAEIVLRTDGFSNGADQEDTAEPQTVLLSNGQFATVYSENDNFGGVNERTIEVRISGAGGTNSILINNVSIPDGEADSNPSIAALNDGRFVVVWQEDGDVRGSIYNNDGTVVSSDFTVTSNASLTFTDPQVIGLEDGSYFVTFKDETLDRLFGLRQIDGSQIGFTYQIDDTLKDASVTDYGVGLTTDGRILVSWDNGDNVFTKILDPREVVISVDANDGVTTGRQDGSSIIGSSQDDVIFAVDGDDLVRAGSGDDDVKGGAGSDSIYGEDGNDRLQGNRDNDSLYGGAGDDQLLGGADDDRLDGGLGNDLLDGGDGTDIAQYVDIANRVVVNLENQGMVQNTRGGGRDTLISIEVVIGGFGNDKLIGDAGNNTLSGSSGDDRLIGNAGNDVLFGSTGNDKMTGGEGSDVLIGGLDDDVYFIDAGDFLSEDVDEGEDTVWVDFNYTLRDNFENLQVRYGDINGTGNALDNKIVASGGSNTLRGLDGNDTLYGRNAADILDGGSGNDRLFGGYGADALTGGSGEDRFIYDEALDLGDRIDRADVITDFSSAEGDRINLVDVDANTNAGGNQDFAFLGTSAFTSTAGEMRYYFDGGRTIVEMDTDGDASGDLFLRLEGQIALAAFNFIGASNALPPPMTPMDIDMLPRMEFFA